MAAVRRSARCTRARDDLDGPVRHRPPAGPERAPLSPLRALPFLGVYAADTIAGLAAALASGQEAGDAIAASCRFRIAVTGDNAAQREDRVRQAFALLQGTTEPTTRTLAEGIHLGCGPAQGELAFVFTGAAGAYADMGRDLALAFPGGVDGLAARAHSLRDAAGWVYAGDAGATAAATPSDKLWGASYLAQLHTEVTRGLLGLRPTAAIGYCSGETNSLFALGAWNDLDGFRDADAGSQVYEKWLCGEFACLRAAWELPAGEAAEWSTWRFRAPVADVRAALEGEPRANLVIVNTANDVVVAGEPQACARVAARFPRRATRTPGYDFVMHSPEAGEYEARWRAIHTRPTTAVPGVRFYTHATLASYEADTQTVADALTGQAMNRVDFPALVERVWADGVRVFVEHGPHAGCTKWIGEILAGRPHLAVALDWYGVSSLTQVVDAAARLFASGVPIQLEALRARLASVATPELRPPAGAVAAPARKGLPLSLPAHPPHVPPMPRAVSATEPVPPPPSDVENGEWMAPAPLLGAVTGPQPAWKAPTRTMAADPGRPGDRPVLASTFRPLPAAVTNARHAFDHLAAHHGRVGELHRAFLRQQIGAQRQFTQLMVSTWSRAHARGESGRPAPVAAVTSPVPVASVTSPATLPQVAPAAAARSAPARVPQGAATALAAPVPRPPTGPRFDRAALEILAGGEISRIFGAASPAGRLRPPGAHARAAAAPGGPRARASTASRGSMGLGTIWTETDVARRTLVPARRPHAGGRDDRGGPGRPAADLAGWASTRSTGASASTACSAASSRTTAGCRSPGDTLRYEIHVDGHAQQGDVRLFFFHYDCTVDGDAAPDACATGRPASSPTRSSPSRRGVLWDRRERGDSKPDARLDAPRGRLRRARAFDAERHPRVRRGPTSHECFGAASSSRRTHARTPAHRRRADAAPRRGDATSTPSGGPWGRGYLRAELPLAPDDWFFAGALQERPLHARHADVRGLPAGDGVLPRRARLHARSRRLALRARARSRRTRCVAAAR